MKIMKVAVNFKHSIWVVLPEIWLNTNDISVWGCLLSAAYSPEWLKQSLSLSNADKHKHWKFEQNLSDGCTLLTEVVPCILADKYQHFWGMCFLHLEVRVLNVEMACFSKMSTAWTAESSNFIVYALRTLDLAVILLLTVGTCRQLHCHLGVNLWCTWDVQNFWRIWWR